VLRVLGVRGQKLLSQSKAGRPARQLGKQGSIAVPTFTVNIFAAATSRTNKIKQGSLREPLSSLIKIRFLSGPYLSFNLTQDELVSKLYRL
jgi:hypothetical protein